MDMLLSLFSFCFLCVISSLFVLFSLLQWLGCFSAFSVSLALHLPLSLFSPRHHHCATSPLSIHIPLSPPRCTHTHTHELFLSLPIMCTRLHTQTVTHTSSPAHDSFSDAVMQWQECVRPFCSHSLYTTVQGSPPCALARPFLFFLLSFRLSELC